MLPEHQDFLKELAASKLGIVLTDKQIHQFSIYGDLLVEWNERVNLTSILEPQEIVVKHFLDSLTLAQWVRGESLVDIGTGAGFPGIPLKILYPNKKFHLVDSLAKRLEFLKEVIEKLDLSGVEVIHSRAEDFGRNPLYRGKFDTSVSRAVARLPVLLEYCIPLLKVNGLFIAAKGSQGENEIEESGNALEILGAHVKDVQNFNLGSEAEHRSLIIIEKIRETPNIYPRKAGTPAKKPL